MWYQPVLGWEFAAGLGQWSLDYQHFGFQHKLIHAQVLMLTREIAKFLTDINIILHFKRFSFYQISCKLRIKI